MTTSQRWLIRLGDSAAWRARRPIAAALATTALVLVLAVTPTASDVKAASMFDSLRSPGQVAFIAGHRGEKVLAPENTLPAFQLAIDSSAEFVETDVQLTSDGVPIIMHDWTLDRTTNGSGPVWEWTAEQISALDAGSWFSPDFAGTRVPTLEQFLDLVWTSDKRAILELKGSWTREQTALVSQQVRTAGMEDRVLIASFDVVTLQAVAEVAPHLPRLIISRQVTGDPSILAALCGAVAIVTSKAFLEREPGAVDRIHEAGLGVLVYTLNDEKTWGEAIALGVDGIITDSPTELERWLDGPSPWAHDG